MLNVLAVLVAAHVPSLWIAHPTLSPERVRISTAKFGLLHKENGHLILKLNGRSSLESAATHLRKLGYRVWLSRPPIPVHTNLKQVGPYATFVEFQRRTPVGPRASGEADSFYDSLEHYLKSRVDASGLFDIVRYQQAIAQRERMPVAKWAGPRSPNGIFSFVGPTNLPVPYQVYFGVSPLSGRKNGVAVGTNGVVCVASAGGGIWRSLDGGITFVNVSNSWPVQDMGSVAIHPTNPNVVIAGTGDKNGFPGLSDGIYRSIDGGSTWVKASASVISSAQAVTKIQFDPLNPSVVIASTRDVSGAAGAVYRSLNAGESWVRITTLPFGQWRDVDVSPVFAGTRTWWAAEDRVDGPGIWFSTNGGSNWTRVTPPYTTPEARVEVAASRVTPGRVYFVSASNMQIWRGSTTGGWTRIDAGFPQGTAQVGNWSQSGYDNHITCTPNGANDRVWVGLITLSVSNTSGGNWLDLGRTYLADARTHNDQHDMIADPNTTNTFWVCNDGGLYRLTYDGGGNIQFASFPNATIGDVQPVRMAVHRSSPNHIILGTQDNASPALRGAGTPWVNLQGGDGGFAGYDYSVSGRHMSSAQNGLFFSYNNYTTLNPSGLPAVPNGLFITPFAYAGSTATPYSATNAIYRYDGSSWVAASAAIPLAQCMERGANSSRLWIGCQNGTVLRTPNLGGTVQTVAVLAGAVNDIKESGYAPETILCAVGGPQSTVVRITNANLPSRTITALRGTGATALPAANVNCVEIDPDEPNVYYVGTDIGLFISTDAGASWARMSPLGLPNVRVTDLHVDYASRTLMIATFGRGVWRLPLRVQQVSFAFSRNEVYGGSSVSLTASLEVPAPPGGLNLQIINPVNLTIPATLSFAQGEKSKTLSVGTSIVSFSQLASFQCNYNNALLTASLQLHPRIQVAGFNWQQNAVYPGEMAYGDIATNIQAPLDATILCQSTDNLIAHPKYVTVRRGTSVAFCDGTAQPVTSSTLVTTTVGIWGTLASDTIVVVPAPRFRDLIISPGAVYGGASATGTLRLLDRSEHAFIYSMSSSSSYATPSPSATMPSKVFSSTFQITSQTTFVDRSATITASWNGQTTSRTMTLYALPIISMFQFDTSQIGSFGTTGLSVFVSRVIKYPGIALELQSSHPALPVPATSPMPVGDDFINVQCTASQVSQTTFVTVTGGFGGQTSTATITVVP